MPGRRFIVQVSGRPAPGDLTGLDPVRDGFSVGTVMRASVRDQAALQGLLRRIHDLGLHLQDLHVVAGGAAGSAGASEVEITVEGPVGELVEVTLTDYIGPIRVSSRYSFGDTAVMGELLTRLLARGVDLERASDQDDSSPLPFTGA